MPNGLFARLKRCVYGTRDAGAIWEECYASALIKMGFRRGIANPCCFTHPEKKLSLVVHGDDMTCLGPIPALRWYEKQPAEAFEIKLKGILSEAPGCVREMRVLNRIVKLTSEGSHTRPTPATSR